MLVIVLALLLSGTFGADPQPTSATGIQTPSSEAGSSSDGAAPADRDGRWRGPESAAVTGARAWQTDPAYRLAAAAAVSGAGDGAPPAPIHVFSAHHTARPLASRLTDSLRI
jgi:hypothetical protein